MELLFCIFIYLFLCTDNMLSSTKDNIKNNICNNALDTVTMGYNESFLASLKTNWHIYILCKDDSKQATKRKLGHRLAESGH